DCHKVKPAGKATGLQRAYHKQCIDCHRTKGKGPLACGQCHVR
ncbi:MAG: acidic cytochrome c3, partial [Desulfovibrio sp.]|nr:acidic cytochrome c3 [Desulfovibrio sp.]